MTPRKIRKKRKCGHCNLVLTTDADGFIEHSFREHGESRPPRPPSKGRGYAPSLLSILAQTIFGPKVKKASSR